VANHPHSAITVPKRSERCAIINKRFAIIKATQFFKKGKRKLDELANIIGKNYWKALL
jgi:hypothetical protein